MKNRARVEDRLALAEELLDREQLAVAQDGLQGRHLGIGAEHEDAIKPCLLGELAGIDLEYRFALQVATLAQIAPIAGLADECLLPAPQGILQACDDGLTVQAILLGLGLVAADNITPTLELDLLGEELCLSPLALDQQPASTSASTGASARATGSALGLLGRFSRNYLRRPASNSMSMAFAIAA
jgi:hypothetical protein